MLDVGGMILLIYKYLILRDISAVKLQIWAVTCMNANFESYHTTDFFIEPAFLKKFSECLLKFLSSMGQWN